ncbi:MAG TPA: DUF72 domain-containing protein [Flavobacterium sp.]|jgi:uncharacterized protein YecE (DUF72 family)
MDNQLLIGCSAYNNLQWTGIFFPEDIPRSRWFEYYAGHFQTYEINSSFYKFPTAKSLNMWYRKSPDGYLFSVKAPKYITHNKRFQDCSQQMEDFYNACRDGLGEKLACTLFQLPPNFAYDPEKLELIIESLDYTFRNVIEFRNESWWRPEVFDMLREKNIAFCSVSYPMLPDDVIQTNDILYIRLHGDERLFYSGYDNERMERLFHRIRNHSFSQAFIYFNNTAGTEGILNALKMKSFLEK